MSDSDEERTKSGELFSAIRKGNLSEVKSLLESGVKVTVIDRNNKDNTPLHYAVEKKKQYIVEELLDPRWHADINARNNKSETALDIAQRLCCQGIVNVLKSHKKSDQPISVKKESECQRVLQENSFDNSKELSDQLNRLKLKGNSNKCHFSKRAGTTGSLDGHFYEIDLLILGKLRGTKETDKFYLATNVDGLGAFDDVVMKYWTTSDKEEKSITIFLQAKHVENSNKDKITIEKFTNPKKDKFYLGKYFFDYLSSREKFNAQSKDPILQGNFEELDLRYIIYTNAILDQQFDKNRIIDVDKNIFSTESKNGKDKAFKFSLNDENSDVIAILESLSCQKRIKLIAKALIDCISSKLNYKNMMGNNELLSTYHVYLAKNVIDVGDEIKEDEKKNQYREGRINHDFLNIDSVDLFTKVLKEEVLHEYAKNIMFNEKSSLTLNNGSEQDNLVNKVAQLLQSSKKVDEDIIKKLGGSVIILDAKKKQLKFADQDKIKDKDAKQFLKNLKSKVSNLADYEFDIPHKLVRETLEEQIKKEPFKLHVDFGNIRPNFKKLDHLVKKFIELFEKYKSNKIITIDESVVGHKKILTDGDLKNIGKLIGNLLRIDEKSKMLKLANRQSFGEHIGKLIESLKIAGQSRDLEIFDYRFEIKVKNFPRETLVAEDNDRSNAEEFLTKLQIFTGQANDKDLMEIIRDELRLSYMLNKKEAEDTFMKIRDVTANYWKEGDYYLEKSDNFFTNIVRFNIQFDVKEPISSFSGREKELRDLHDRIQNSSEKLTVIVPISGLGGMGKTQLARKYAQEHRNHYNGNIIWINAESYQTLVQSFRKLAFDKLDICSKNAEGIEKSIESIVEESYEFFSKRKSLFIFDNAEKLRNQNDEDEGIDRFLPNLISDANKPYILITSRNQKWGNMLALSLGPFTDMEAMDYVRKTLEIKDDTHTNEIQKLVEVLQRFPLALAQAVAYIKQADEEVKNVDPEREYKIDDYLEEFEKKTKELLDYPFPDDSNDKYTRTTFTTWIVTIDKLKEKVNGKDALEILNVIAYCAPDNIPSKMFLKLVENDVRRLGATIQLLKQYSMINIDKGILSVHRLVQEVIKLNSKSVEKEILRKALGLFKFDVSNIELFLKDLRLDNVDHAISVWRYANKHGELVRDFKNLPVAIVSELRLSLRYQEAEFFGRTALELLRTTLLGDDHLSVFSMMINIASVLYDLGKNKESLKMYRILKEKSDVVNKLTWPVKLNIFDGKIGLLLNRLGQHSEALAIFSEQYHHVKEGIMDSDGSIEHNLGVTLLEQNRIDEAMEMFTKSLNLKNLTFGPDDESTLNTKNSISTAFEKQGKYEDAVELSWKIYEKRKKILGPNHPNTLTTYGNIALTLTKLDRCEEALKIAIEVDKERKKTIPNHPRTLKGKFLIVGILEIQGKYDEALEKCKKVYEKRKEILGPRHEDTIATLDCWCGLAQRLAKQGEYDKALKEFNNVLVEMKKIFEPCDSKILQVKDSINKVHRLRNGDNSIKFKNIDGNLFHATVNNQLNVVKELLNNGAAVDIQDGDQYFSPLHVAASRGYIGIANALLEADASVDLEDLANYTALHYSAQNGHLNVLNVLLKYGANVNKINDQGETPLYLATAYGHKYIVQTLLKVKGIDVNVKRTDMITCMHSAAGNGNTEVIMLLLKHNANMEATNSYGWTPLHNAAFGNHVNAVIVLLDEGANINAVSKNNREPSLNTTNDCIKKILNSTRELFSAVRNKQTASAVRQLLENWARVNAVSGTDKLTVLHFAVFNGDLSVIEALLEKRPKINAVDVDCWTPLHYASQEGHLDIVKLLLHHGANPFAENNDKQTPLDLARDNLSRNPQVYREIINILKLTSNPSIQCVLNQFRDLRLS